MQSISWCRAAEDKSTRRVGIVTVSPPPLSFWFQQVSLCLRCHYLSLPPFLLLVFLTWMCGERLGGTTGALQGGAIICTVSGNKRFRGFKTPPPLYGQIWPLITTKQVISKGVIIRLLHWMFLSSMQPVDQEAGSHCVEL